MLKKSAYLVLLVTLFGTNIFAGHVCNKLAEGPCKSNESCLWDRGACRVNCSKLEKKEQCMAQMSCHWHSKTNKCK